MGEMTIEKLKQMATEQSFLKGLSYYNEDAVSKPSYADGVLKAEVEGSYRDYYKVQLAIDPPYEYHCTCPYDWGGICKHIVALGLAWIYDPGIFTDEKEKQQTLKNELNEIINVMEKEDLVSFLITLISEDQSIKLKLLDFLEKRGKMTRSWEEEKLKALMAEALPIIEEFNAYGGGPEEDEERCWRFLGEIEEILQSEDSVPSQLRQEVINALLVEYIKGNSGLNDAILGTIYEVAKSKEDWELIIEGLQKTGNNYDQNHIMKIYLHKLEDEQKYLEMRKKDLEYGRDYFDLVQYYHQIGDQDKAVNAAREGEKLGKGRIIDNITYLKNYYYQLGDDEKTREYALKEFNIEPSLERYLSIIENCKSTPEKEILRGELKGFLQEGTPYSSKDLLAAIYFQEEDYNKVLELVLKQRVNPEQYEKTLVELFPREMITYYQKEVQAQINNKTRNSYIFATQIASKIKGIYRQLSALKEWEAYLQGILKEYPRHRALQEEFKKLC